MALVQPVLHRLSRSNEMVRHAPKHGIWVQWSGSGAFVAKKASTTSFSELVRKRHQFGQFFIDFRAITERSETPRFLVQWSGSGTFVVKNSHVTSFSELVR
jgi:hypothetical protein